MNKKYNVLIIDDHQIIIDTFKNALTVVKNDLENIDFYTDQAKDCESALKKINDTSENIDLFFLDISLPPSLNNKILSGEDLGIKIKKYFPKAKIIVCTSFNDNLRLNNIIKTINPDSLVVKSDIDFKDIIESVKSVLNNETFYSKTVINLLRKKVSSPFILCDYDIQILHEISNGARMKELVELIPLSKTGIEKRKRKLRHYFNVNNDSDRKLILVAREKGFI